MMSEQGEKQGDIWLEKLKDELQRRDYQYEIQLGKGSYSSAVIQAKYLSSKDAEALEESNTKYAIKILPIVYGKTAKYTARELEFLQKKECSHENIVKYSTSWKMTIDKSQYLCIRMELCRVNLWVFVYNNTIKGLENAEIIKFQGSPRFYQHVFPQVLRALSFIHDEIGWVHRDIHPGNILIANPNPEKITDITVKIADFGLARDMPNLKAESLAFTDGVELKKLSPNVGNEFFRAPELETGCYDYKVDLYSAGIMLYFLSRYLEEKVQWNDEITAFKEGKRRSDVLCHQDDNHLVYLIQLLMKKRENRPTAKEALKIAEKLGECAQEPVESQALVKPDVHGQSAVDGKSNEKKFFIKTGDTYWNRCQIEDDTLNLSSLKAAMERLLQVKVQSLWQTTLEDVKEKRINITSDDNVHEMFLSAEKAKERIYIFVSEKKSASEHSEEKEVEFRIKKKDESAWNPWFEKGSALNISKLQKAIEYFTKIKPESQLLERETTEDGIREYTKITFIQDFEEMFQNAKNTGKKTSIIVSEKPTADVPKEKFLVKEDDETVWDRCSLKRNNLTLSGLREARECSLNIKIESRKLVQKRTEEINIKSDKNVQEMFQSAEKKGDKVHIVVKDEKLDMYT